MNLDLMVVIDKQLLDTPFHGAQQMAWHLQNEGHVVNDKRSRRLMRRRRENHFASQLIHRINCFGSHPDCFLALRPADLPEV